MYGGGFSRRGGVVVCFGVAWMVGRGISIGPSSTVHVSMAVHVCAIRCVGDVSVSNRCTRSLWFLVDPFVRNAACALVHYDLVEYSSPPTFLHTVELSRLVPVLQPHESCSAGLTDPGRNHVRPGRVYLQLMYQVLQVLSCVVPR